MMSYWEVFLRRDFFLIMIGNVSCRPPASNNAIRNSNAIASAGIPEASAEISEPGEDGTAISTTSVRESKIWNLIGSFKEEFNYSQVSLASFLHLLKIMMLVCEILIIIIAFICECLQVCMA